MDSRQPPPVPPRPPEIVVRQANELLQAGASPISAQPPLGAHQDAQLAARQHVQPSQIPHAQGQASKELTERFAALDYVQTEVMTTQFPAADAPAVQELDDMLPSYAQLRQNEPANPRFGRWRGWVEKRAREQNNERAQEREAGNSKRSWDLDDSMPPRKFSDDSQEAARRKKQDLIEQRMSRYTLVPVDLNSGSEGADEDSGTDSSSAQPSVTTGRMDELTHSLAMHFLGSRFASGLPDEPLCACILPLGGGRQHSGMKMDRFLLVGSRKGLFLVDLLPGMGSATLASSQATDVQIYQLWNGPGVLQLDVHQEAEDRSGQPLGVVTALVQMPTHNASIRMWSLGSLLNLARWRIYTQGSTCLDVDFIPGSVNHSPVYLHRKAPSNSGGFIRSFFGGRQTGKGKARESDEVRDGEPAEEHSQGAELGERFSLPLAWIQSSVLLPLPRGHGPILFFERIQMPCRNETGRRAVREEQDVHGYLFLIVATARTIYVFESRATERRTWKLSKELFAPSTPTNVSLVRLRSALTSDTGPYPADLAIFLGMSSRAALINLNDSSVTELDLPGSSSGRHRSKSSVSASSSLSAKSSLSARASVIGSQALHHVSSLVEGSKAVPAGIRGSEKQIALGKKLDDALAVEGLTNADGRWSACLSLTVNATDDEMLHMVLITRGNLTHLLVNEGSTLDSSSRLLPLHTFIWPSSSVPIYDVTALVRRNSLKPTFAAAGFVHLLLIGFVPTGLVAQEGILDTALLNLLIRSKSTHLPSSEGVFKRLGSFGLPVSPEWPLHEPVRHHVDPSDLDQIDVQDTASLDFGRQVKYLTPGGPWSNSTKMATSVNGQQDSQATDENDESRAQVHQAIIEAAEQQTRSGVFISVQGLSGWSLQWIG
ncbi:hypothetical protein OIV83_000713 [Microbotryomycetes sp. JL201]|nr:hypothetical protein OIV83_000713 [Microbotryomycetes sp. JL201]